MSDDKLPKEKSSISPGSVFSQRHVQDQDKKRECILAGQRFFALLEEAQQKTQSLDKLLEPEHHIEKKKVAVYLQLLQDIDELYEAQDWTISLFFRNLADRICETREGLREILHIETLAPAENHLTVVPEGYRRVFISLYQAEGENLKRWEAVLANLHLLGIGRPVYAKETEVQIALKAKADNRCDAYVSVDVLEKDVVPAIGGIVPHDRLGNHLLTLRDGAIKIQNIVEFVRLVGRPETRYHFIKNELKVI